MEVFNSFISDVALREIHSGGSRFTWTNKQESPIQSVLDRILATADWELHYPRTTVKTLLRVGSDHNPLLLDTGNTNNVKPNFRFEEAWMTREGFKEKVIVKWPK
ncbi:hypothetical protein PR202_ga11494 [Eleusine coracana subsp. coracana]|uniref:Uncharacterized protein n=1 Tax=Eleusine coracana subsp. coracana TaxID=191504 RepID=A0AAV5C9K5_ELECO|nr:hypothetical protein PR202_ga11494 [Eleusine coracana subsp. coracana]